MASSNDSLPATLLETLLPGFSLLSTLVSLYLYVDVSYYSFYICLIVACWAIITFFIPTLLDKLEQLILYVCASIDIPFQDEMYHHAMEWISKHKELSQTRRSIVGTKASYSTLWHDQDEEEEAEEEKEEAANDQSSWQDLRLLSQKKSIFCSPTKDEIHPFFYKDCLFFLRRKATPNPRSPWLALAETIELFTSPWNRQKLMELLDEMQEISLKRKCKHITIYLAMKLVEYQWAQIASKPPGALSTVVLDKYQKDKFQEDIENFFRPSTRHWYRQNNSPYRRGYLFHGRPGTGKSSLCFAAASLLGLDIYKLSFDNVDEQDLSIVLCELPRRCILLIEDIDTAGMQRHGLKADEDRDMEDNKRPKTATISLAALLNAIDGVGAMEGRAVIFTTNYREKLDDAWVRPGRVDMEITFDYASQSIIEELFVTFYTPKDAKSSWPPATSDSTRKDELIRLSARFAKLVPSGQLAPAEIQNYLLQHRENPNAAVERISEWIRQWQSDHRRPSAVVNLSESIDD